jgi:PPK2 family polyphosphate:nucleotide phosphotransferase
MPQPILFEPVDNPYLVSYDDTFKIHQAATKPPHDAPDKHEAVALLAKSIERMQKLQGRLYAHDRYAVLLIFQAMDAAGKDGTIKAVMTGINPQGCQVYAFKAPSSQELDHDFMWRINRALPERGRIGIFNRSHYEEVLVARVNPELLEHEKLPHRPKHDSDLWAERLESIADAEKHWARNGTVVLKFFLHVSQKEQHRRFLDRLTNPDDNWKFELSDIHESRKWERYMDAYQTAMRATSKPWAPWYAIPADSKPYMRHAVANIVVDTIAQLPLTYPVVRAADRAELDKVREELEAE